MNKAPTLGYKKRACLCRICNRIFAGISQFTKHRIGDWAERRCKTDEELRESKVSWWEYKK